MVSFWLHRCFYTTSRYSTEFDPANPLHVAISEAGETAAAGAAKQLAQLREQRDNVTVTIARREIRKWLRESDEGKTVEEVVGKLLAGG